MRACFAAVLAGAGFEIARVPGAGCCADCAKTVPLAGRFCVCPEGWKPHVRMTAGAELRVREVEMA